MTQPNIRGGICYASICYARANNKLMNSVYNPRLSTSYIMAVDANNLYGWAMSQEMPDNDFEFVTDDDCRNMEQLLNYAKSRIAIFNTGLFDYRENENDKNIFIFEVDFEYQTEQHERANDYPPAPKVMTIEFETTSKKQHNLRAEYFGAAFPYSRKLIRSFFPTKHYVMLGQLLLFDLDREMRLVILHHAICLNFSLYDASYIANNTAKRQQFKHDDVKNTIYKLINNAPYGKTIENITLQNDIRLLNVMDNARILVENLYCVDFRVLYDQVAPPEEQVKAAAAEEQQLQKALVRTDMQQLNHFINKTFANNLCVLEYSKLTMYVTYLPLF